MNGRLIPRLVPPLLARSVVLAFLVVSAGSCGAASDSPLEPPVDEPPELVTISGLVETLNGVPHTSLVAVSQTGVYADTGAVGPDGTFSVTALRAGTDSTVVVIRAPSGSLAPYHSSWKILPPLEKDAALRVLLIPRVWTIREGSLAPRTIPVSLQVAFVPENGVGGGSGGGGLLGVGREVGVDGLDLSAELWSWPQDRLPIPVYFEHAGKDFNGYGLDRSDVSASDSVSVWDALDDLQDRLGFKLFRPARREELPVDSLIVFGLEGLEHRLFSIAIELVPDLPVGGLGGSARACEGPPEVPDGVCGRFLSGDLVEGRMSFKPPDEFDDPGTWPFLVQHEMGHVLGFGHACYYPSIMTSICSPIGVTVLEESSNSRATAYDVAYMQLYWMAHSRSLELRPHLGLKEALEGERMELGLGRLPWGWPGG